MHRRAWLDGRRLRRFAGAALPLAALQTIEPQGSHAQELTTVCRFESAGGGKVAKILDGRSFVLADGREIRLAGIEVPPAPRAGEEGARAAAGAAAKAALEALLAGQTVELGRASTDRYGRIIAYVDVISNGGARPVSHAMLGGGHARVAAQVETPACAAELLAREHEARAAKRGLWADPHYGILEAASGSALLAERGHFAVVEGKVLSVRESGGNIFLNFGRRWSQALTVTISKRHERMFTAAGLQPKALERRLLRVRGWIDDRNGPRIEAARPEQIEITGMN